MDSKLLSVFTLFLCVVSFVSAQRNKNCDQTLIEADKCLKKLLYVGDWNLTFIKNEADLANHCRETKKDMVCIKKYQKCLNNFPREVFNLMSRNARQLNKERCEEAKGKAEFLKHIKCLDESTITVNVCMDKVIILLDYIANNITSTDRETILGSTCCAVHLGLGCFTSKVAENCAKKTGADTAAYVTSKVNQMVADVFDLACAKTPDVASCDKAVPELMKTYRSLIDKPTVKRQQISPLIPLMKVVKKIEL